MVDLFGTDEDRGFAVLVLEAVLLVFADDDDRDGAKSFPRLHRILSRHDLSTLALASHATPVLCFSGIFDL